MKIYDEKPNWMHLFDPVATSSEQERQTLERENDRVIKDVAYLEGDLQADEDGAVDYRVKSRFDKTTGMVTDAFSAMQEALEQHAKLLETASVEAEALVAMLEWALEFHAAVLMHDHVDESHDWARENLRGDWHTFTYRQERYNPPITKRIFLFSDDVDRLNFKMRWS